MFQRRILIYIATIYAIVFLVSWNAFRLSSEPSFREHSSFAFLKDSLQAIRRPIHTINNRTAWHRKAIAERYITLAKTDSFVAPRKIAGQCNHVPKNQTSYSTVEFTTCCGLGHRLARMSTAAYVAIELNAGLHAFWQCCDTIDVFTYLFGEQPLLLGDHSPTTNDPVHLQFRDGVPGFQLLRVMGTNDRCPCTKEKTDADYAFYTALMERYHQRNVLDAFSEKHFANHTVIGLHIRAGNGEKGDFVRKQRQINDKWAFIRSIGETLVKMKSKISQSPILFVATDTSSYVEELRSSLRDVMSVIDLPQIRIDDGEGVLFGAPHSVVQTGESCLSGWDAALQDMMLLSRTDIVLAATRSSFTQTMPMSLVLGRPDRKVKAPYCEMDDGKIRCYKSVQEWSCRRQPSTSYGDTFYDVHPDWRLF